MKSASRWFQYTEVRICVFPGSRNFYVKPSMKNNVTQLNILQFLKAYFLTSPNHPHYFSCYIKTKIFLFYCAHRLQKTINHNIKTTFMVKQLQNLMILAIYICINLQVGIYVFRVEILPSCEILGYDKWWLFPVISTSTKTLLFKSSVSSSILITAISCAKKKNVSRSNKFE
jgi:hypothetical protein